MFAKRTAAIIASIVAVMAMLSACTPQKLDLEQSTDASSVHIEAENSTGETAGSLSLGEGASVDVESHISSGEVEVFLLDEQGAVMLSAAFTGEEKLTSPIGTGNVTIKVATKNANGVVEATTTPASASSSSQTSSWQQAPNIQQAADFAGLDSFQIPEMAEMANVPYKAELFSATKDIAEVVYKSEVGSICIRKARGIEIDDITEDNNSYPEEWSWDVNGIQVQSKGYEPDKAAHMSWTSDGNKYAIVCFGLNGPAGMAFEDAERLVSNIR